MNRIEITQLKNLLSLMNEIGKYSVYLEDIINKESVKREKNIENTTKYINNKKKDTVNSNNYELSPELQSFIKKWRESQKTQESYDNDISTETSEEHDDLD